MMHWLSSGLITMLLAVAAEGASAAPAAKTPAQGKAPGQQSIHRTVIHTEAYKKREYLGPHINFKITPPEKRGRKNHVLVEVYNYSKVYVNVVDFYLNLYSDWGDKIEVQITADDIMPGWSALKWVKVPGSKPIPAITKVEIQNFVVFDKEGKKVALKYYTDLIKK